MESLEIWPYSSVNSELPLALVQLLVVAIVKELQTFIARVSFTKEHQHLKTKVTYQVSLEVEALVFEQP